MMRTRNSLGSFEVLKILWALWKDKSLRQIVLLLVSLPPRSSVTCTIFRADSAYEFDRINPDDLFLRSPGR